jgi:starvation-inducible DNA-binding protein
MGTINRTTEQSSAVIALLNARLADTLDLVYQAKQAHWNVNGSDFFSLHELFDKVADELPEHVDEIAERVAQLGGVVEGTIRMVSARTSLPEMPREGTGGEVWVEALTRSLGIAGASMREAIDQSSDLGDQVTSDIFTGAARTIDKLTWMVRAHLEGGVGVRPSQAAPERKHEQVARPRH